MTNTPMTKEEAFESWWGASKYTQVIYHKDSNYQIAKDAWQASQAQQAQIIAELVEALQPLANFAQHYPKVKTFGNRPTEGDIHSVMDSTGEHSITVEDAHRAFEIIAKVKGK